MKFLNYIYPFLFLTLFFGQAALAQKKNSKRELSDKERLRFERLYMDAGKAKILEDYEQSIKLFEASSKADPNQSAPYYELGALYMHFGEADLAIENSKKAAEMEPNNLYYRMNYAEVLKKTQQLDLALKEYEAMVKLFPNNFPFYLDIAMIYLVKKEYPKAIESYDALEEKIGITEEISMKKQFLYLQAGQVDKAANEIEKLISFNPDNPTYYLLLAEVYYINGFDEKALKIYKRATTSFPDNPEIHLSLAEFYRSKKQYNKAFEHTAIAFKSPNLDVDQKVQTVLVYFDVLNENSGYGDKILELGKIMEDAHPEDARVLTINGDINLNLNKPLKARNYFMHAVEVDASRFPIWNQLLILEADLAIFDTLEIHSKQSSELFPNQPLCFYFLGYARTQLKEYESAAEAYNDGLKIVVDNDLLKVQFYLGLAEAYNESGNHEMSDEAFETVLSKDSNNTIALNNYSYYLSVRGEKLNRAKALSARSNSLEPNQPTYLDTYAWILYKIGAFEEAKVWMEKALKYGGSKSGVILEHMGDILYKLDEKNEAVKYWQKAKETGDGTDLLDKKLSDGVLYE